ncbi:MAG: AlkA N-terminal domain-containing protein [Eggerthella lenta]
MGYRPPYRFDLLLEFLRLRAIEGVEAVEDGAYCARCASRRTRRV